MKHTLFILSVFVLALKKSENRKIIIINNETKMENLNKLDMDGNTPLMIAAASGNLIEVQRLIELGADPSLKDRFGMTAYLIAKNLGHENIMKFLNEINTLEADKLESFSSTTKAEPQHIKNLEVARLDLEVIKNIQVNTDILNMFVWIIHLLALIGFQFTLQNSEYSFRDASLVFNLNIYAITSVLVSFFIFKALIYIVQSVTMTAKYTIFSSSR